MRAQPPQAKTRRGGFTLPTLPHRRIAPILSSRCISVETKDSRAGERTWYRTGSSTRGFPSHWGFLIAQLSIVGVFPHRGRSFHSPWEESFPTGGGHRTAHLGSPPPPEDEIILFSTGGVFPHRGSPTSHMGGPSYRGRPLHSPLGESPSLKRLPSPNGSCKHGIRTTPHIPMKVRGAPPRSNRNIPLISSKGSTSPFTHSLHYLVGESFPPREFIPLPTEEFPYRGSHQIAYQNHHIQVRTPRSNYPIHGIAHLQAEHTEATEALHVDY